MINPRQQRESEKLTDCADAIKAFLNIYDKGIKSTIVVLDDDAIFRKQVKRNASDSIITIANTTDFKAFVYENGVNKFYIDINLESGENGIDLVEEMGLDDRSAEIIFTSDGMPSPQQLKRIAALGASFITKDNVMGNGQMSIPN